MGGHNRAPGPRGASPPPEETGRAGAVLAWRAPRRLGSHGGCGSARLSPSLPLGSGVSRAPSFPPPNPTGPLYSSSAQPQGWKRRSPSGPRARRRYLAGGAGPAPGGGACGTFRSPDLRRRGAVSGRRATRGALPGGERPAAGETREGRAPRRGQGGRPSGGPSCLRRPARLPRQGRPGLCSAPPAPPPAPRSLPAGAPCLG